MESSSLSKRAKAPSNCPQIAHCLVDGCNADLSLCRDYHRRHKVCEVHSKTPKVLIKGQELRFCQQCSRFHSLEEFDEGKRSCRKRLDGHNRRRRKQQPESMSRNMNQPSFSGPMLISFGMPSSVAATMSMWPGLTKEESNIELYGNQYQQQLASNESFLNFQSFNHQQQHNQPYFFPETAASSAVPDLKFFSESPKVVVSGGALSLLSTAPPSSKASLTFKDADGNEPVHSIAHGFNSDGFSLFDQDTKLEAPPVHYHDSSGVCTTHFQEIFNQHGHGEGSSSGGPRHTHTLSFNWE